MSQRTLANIILNKNENITYLQKGRVIKIHREKLIALCAYMRKECSQINYLRFYHKKVEKVE